MGKLGLLLLLVLAVILWMRFAVSTKRKPGVKKSEEVPGRFEEMAPCAQCGVNVPASEARVGRSGVRYCSDAHQMLAGD